MNPGDLDDTPEQQPQRTRVGEFAGIPVYVDPDCSPRAVKVYDRGGGLIGIIMDVGSINIGR